MGFPVVEQESLGVKFAYLKELMGYPVDNQLDLVYDYEFMEQDIKVDTTQELEYNKHIE